MIKEVFYIYAETQIHAGSGPDVGIVDLPIQRERTTGFPIIQGIKGSIRSSKLLNDEVFGSKPGEDKILPGKLAFSEAKILLFPVRSADRIFVWVTCPLVLKRFANAIDIDIKIPVIDDHETAKIAKKSKNEGEIWIEDLVFKVDKDETISKIAENISECAPDDYIKEKIKNDLVLVSDLMFTDIVKTMTEVVPRIRINEDGIVQERALWYEEYLPQDTVMYFVIRSIAGDNNSAEINKLEKKYISIGGKETVGKGFVFLKKVKKWK